MFKYRIGDEVILDYSKAYETLSNATGELALKKKRLLKDIENARRYHGQKAQIRELKLGVQPLVKILENGPELRVPGCMIYDSTFWHQKALEAIQKQKELTGERDKSDVNQDVTKLLDLELRKSKAEISLEKVEQYVKSGADLDFRDNFGYSFQERAGMKMRYDVVARINELRGGLK